MNIVNSTIREIAPGRFELNIEFLADEIRTHGEEAPHEIGDGPALTGAIPDRIVTALIQAPDHTLSLSQLRSIVGGNPGTVSRQAWTLATNARDLQIRLRGWVHSPERGRYALTPQALKVVKGDN